MESYIAGLTFFACVREYAAYGDSCDADETSGSGDDDDSDDDGDELCTDTCEYAYDGVCDDGGDGSDYDVCEYGTDCDDCGRR